MALYRKPQMVREVDNRDTARIGSGASSAITRLEALENAIQATPAGLEVEPDEEVERVERVPHRQQRHR